MKCDYCGKFTAEREINNICPDCLRTHDYRQFENGYNSCHEQLTKRHASEIKRIKQDYHLSIILSFIFGIFIGIFIMISFK